MRPNDRLHAMRLTFSLVDVRKNQANAMSLGSLTLIALQ